MHKLIPHFIHEQYRAGHLSGTLDAVSLFMDISGFTAMTQTLMQHGQEGAEVMSDSINRVFEPVIQTVYEQGGWITGFAGDAFTALFPLDDELPSLAACATAQAIRQIFVRQGCQQTPWGEFSLAVKMGLSAGHVEWGILGPERHRVYFFRGPAVDGCVRAENQAQAGQIVLDQAVQHLLPPAAVELQTIDANYAKLLPGHPTTPAGKQSPSLHAFAPFHLDTAAHFYPPFLLQATQPDEFRDVVSVFISFQDIPSREGLDTFLSAILDLADRYDGYFNGVDFGDKGGNVQILFGAPVTHEDDIERALSAVLDLQEKSTFRAGVTYGRVRAGYVGIPLRCEYTALGSAVNLAARLLMEADWGQILVSDLVARHPAFDFELLGNLAYKGFADPLPTYRLLGAKTVGEQVFDQALVGREAELEQLLAFAQPLFEGRLAGAALVYGEPGIGKSRLAYALRQELGRSATDSPRPATSHQQAISWFTGQTGQILRQAFNPFVYWLKHYFNQSPEATVGQNKVRFEERLGQLLADLETANVDQALSDQVGHTRSILGALVGLRWPDSLYEGLDAKLRYENTLFAVKNLLLAESHLRPVVFELEDGHWLDEASHELLTTLSRNVAAYPLLVLITSRYADDGSRPAFDLASDMPVMALDLGTLSTAALRQQAASVLGGPVADDLLTLLREKAQANPLFVQQVLYYLQENGLLVQRPDHAWGIKVAAFDVPREINAILVARIDRLAQTVKQVVQTAAVLGREFEVNILSRMLQDQEVLFQVRQAEREQIWTALQELRYLFRHALLRDAVYEMQLRVRLRELHRLAAEAHEQLYEEDLAPYHADLAYHYGQAQDRAKERYYARLAGEQASRDGAMAEAITYLSRALALTADDDIAGRYDLLMTREEVCFLQGDREKQAADLAALAELAGVGAKSDKVLPVETPHLWGVQVLLRQTRYRGAVGDYPAAVTAAAEAFSRAEAVADGRLAAAALYRWGRAFDLQGAFTEAQERYVAGQAQAEAVEAQVELVGNLGGLGRVAYNQGDYTGAQAYLEAALGIAREIGDRWQENRCLVDMGIVIAQQGDFAGARVYWEAALEVTRDMGARRRESSCLNNLGIAAYTQGDYAGAREYYQAALGIDQETGNRQGQASCLGNLGEVAYDQGDYTGAQEYYQAALEIFRQIGDRRGEGIVLHDLGVLARARGHALTTGDRHALAEVLAGAESYFRQALAIREELGQPQYVVEDQAGLAGVALDRGKLAAARAALTPVLDYWVENPTLDGVAYPYRLVLICGQVLSAVGELVQAREIVGPAYARLATLVERLPTLAEQERFWQAPDYAALRCLWEKISNKR